MGISKERFYSIDVLTVFVLFLFCLISMPVKLTWVRNDHQLKGNNGEKEAKPLHSLVKYFQVSFQKELSSCENARCGRPKKKKKSKIKERYAIESIENKKLHNFIGSERIGRNSKETQVYLG